MKGGERRNIWSSPAIYENLCGIGARRYGPYFAPTAQTRSTRPISDIHGAVLPRRMSIPARKRTLYPHSAPKPGLHGSRDEAAPRPAVG